MKPPLDHRWGVTEGSKQFTLRITQAPYLLPWRHSLIGDRPLSTMPLTNRHDEQVVGNFEVMDDKQFLQVLILLEEWASQVSSERLPRQLGVFLLDKHLEELERV